MMFASPIWLLFSILALAPWVGPWAGENRVQNILRSLTMLLLAIGLAQPRVVVEESQMRRVLIVDQSESVADTSLSSQFSELLDPSEIDVFSFGSPLEPSVANRFRSVTHLESDDRRGTSPLADAIAQAQLLIPNGSGASVTIASDSLATRPSDNRAIAALKSNGIPVHWIDLAKAGRQVTPVAVRWSEPLRKGATSRLNVTITAANAGGTVVLKSGTETLASESFAASGQLQQVQLEFEPTESGFLDAVLLASVDDSDAGESLEVTLPIHDAFQLVYFSDLQSGGADKLAKTIGPSFNVIAADPANPSELFGAIAKADLVMLDDFTAASLPANVEEQIVSAVQADGLGLVMSGGRAAFGSGGWHDRPIEALLPIELVQKEEKRDPSTSLVIVIDTSGSMSGVRVQLAKEVARLAMRRLLPHDKVGIVEFYGAKRWAAPLQPASNAIELQRALNRMDAGGGTVILPALEESFYGLQNVDTRYKHVLVLTDGGVEAGDFESLMRRMASEGINVSTVLAGGGYHSEFLVNIANWGKGRFYNVPNRFNLPEILLKQPSTTKLPSYRPGDHAVQARGGTGWWGEVDTTKLTSLAGYVESKSRIGSEVLLETVREKHPVLSSWRYGLGRVTTLTTEPVGAGTKPWQEWDQYGQALARILERSAADSRDPFRYSVHYDGANATVMAQREQPRTSAGPGSRPVAKIVSQDSQQAEQTLTFRQRSPDHFVASVASPAKGNCLRLQTSSTSMPGRSEPLIVASPTAEEMQVGPDTAIDLAEIGTITGGQQLAVLSELSDAPTSDPIGNSLYRVSPLLFGLALLMFLAEIIWRRLPTSSPATAGAEGNA